MDSGCKANSIAFPNHTVEAVKVNRRLSECSGRITPLMMNCDFFGLGCHGLFCGDDAPVNPKREKSIPARCASISGSAKESINPGERAHAMFARNALHIQIAAHSTMDIRNVSDWSGPGKKPRIADSTSPRTQPQRASEIGR